MGDERGLTRAPLDRTWLAGIVGRPEQAVGRRNAISAGQMLARTGAGRQTLTQGLTPGGLSPRRGGNGQAVVVTAIATSTTAAHWLRLLSWTQLPRVVAHRWSALLCRGDVLVHRAEAIDDRNRQQRDRLPTPGPLVAGPDR